jgi:hypothetical protein
MTNYINMFPTVLTHFTWIRMIVCFLSFGILLIVLVDEKNRRITSTNEWKLGHWIVITHLWKNGFVVLLDLNFLFLSAYYPTFRVMLKVLTMGIL